MTTDTIVESPAPQMQILFEDHHVIVVSKPAPLMTQAPVGVPSLEAMVKAYIKEKYFKPAGVYLGMPHRLDRPVTGVVVFCRNTKAARRVAEQFQEHRVVKSYWAMVEGVFSMDSGEWRNHTLKVEDRARAEIVPANTPGAKEAITRFVVRQRYSDQTWLELIPQTGRMHQLRVQASAAGHPVLGDELYGSTRPFGAATELSRERVIALHARSLRFEHPFRRTQLLIEAPTPSYWPTE